MKKLICLCGPKLVGKNTVATIMQQVLWDEYRLDYGTYAFAEPLKRAVAGLTGRRVVVLDSQELKASDSRIEKPNGGYYTYRELLQQMGSLLRGLDNNIFVNALFSKLDSIKPDEFAIITDGREPHEFQAAKDRGGATILITRDTGSIDTHSTETGWQDWAFDYVIENNGTKGELKKKVDAILNELAQ